MLYLRSFNRFLLITFALLGFSFSSAEASLMQIFAEGNQFPAGYAVDFTLVYDDVSGDGLFQLSELVSFPGTSIYTSYYNVDVQSIIGTTYIPNVSTISGDQSYAISGSLNWIFEASIYGVTLAPS